MNNNDGFVVKIKNNYYICPSSLTHLNMKKKTPGMKFENDVARNITPYLNIQHSSDNRFYF